MFTALLSEMMDTLMNLDVSFSDEFHQTFISVESNHTFRPHCETTNYIVQPTGRFY